MKSVAMGDQVACPHKVCNYFLNSKRTDNITTGVQRSHILQKKVLLPHYLDTFRQEKVNSMNSETSLRLFKLRLGQEADNSGTT